MPSQKKKGPRLCQICSEQTHKYTCPRCRIVYCSLGCYKMHKESTCKEVITSAAVETVEPDLPSTESDQDILDEDAESTAPLRPLTSLKWPYVPEESAFPDPLKRDDPKPLQLPQYEAIATSPAIREILASHKQLPALLVSLDKFRGEEREYTLQRALGVTAAQINNNQAEVGNMKGMETDDDMIAFRKLAEAVEAAVRGGKEGALGLDWGD